MRHDPLVLFSREVQGVVEAAVHPLLLLAAIAVLIATASLVRRRLVERGWFHRAPPRRRQSARTGAFVGFHTAAEGAGYPAMLIVSAAGLAAAVAAIVILALTGAIWLFALAVITELVALAMLGAAINAAFEGPVAGADRPRRRTSLRLHGGRS